MIIENHFLYSLALTLVHFLWQGLLIACVLKVFYAFISPQKALSRYTLATLAMVSNLLFPIITFAIIYQTNFAQLNQSDYIISSLVVPIPYSDSYDFSENLAEYFPYLTLLWLLGVSYLTLKLLYELRYVKLLRISGVSPADNMLNQQFMLLANKLNITQMPTLLISTNATIPMAIGWLKPIVLLPASMLSGLTAEQLEMLLLHELAHIKRYDYVINFLQTLVEILLFFHPAVHWVSVQMRNEREFCSDDIAVHHCKQPIAYARTLTETAALCQNHHHSIPQMALAASGGDLKKRVIRLVDSHCTANSDNSKWFAGFFILISALMIISKQWLTVAAIENTFSYLPFYFNNTSSKLEPNNKIKQQLGENTLAQHLLAKRPIAQSIKQSTTIPIIHTELNDNAAEIIMPTDSLTTTEISAANINRLKSTASLHAVDNNTLQFVNKMPKIKLSQDHLNKKDTLKKTTAKTAHSITKDLLVNQHNSNQTQATSNETSNQQPTSTDTLISTQLKKKTAAADKDILAQYEQPKSSYQQQLATLAKDDLLTTSPRTIPDVPIIRSEEQSNGMQNALLISSLSPKYPTLAQRNKIEAEVLVHFTIDTKGFVRDIYFEAAPNTKISLFKRVIRNALKKWRFAPAQLNGHAVESNMSKIFSFNLTE
jgi:TonB family protein